MINGAILLLGIAIIGFSLYAGLSASVDTYNQTKDDNESQR